MDASVKSYPEILGITLEAWQELPLKVHQSAWIVTGYFSPQHFDEALGVQDVGLVGSPEEAKHILDPCSVLDGCKIAPTPQFCSRFEWQIQDSLLPHSQDIRCLTKGVLT